MTAAAPPRPSGWLEYDLERHALIFTERLSKTVAGASSIVGSYGIKTDARGGFVHPRLGVAALRESWDPERVPEPEQPPP